MLTIENLSKTFTIHNLGGKTIQGFKNVSLQVEEGGTLGLAGPSGVGKSSVLKCIYRTYLPGSGSILYTSNRYGEVDLVSLSEYEILQLRSDEIGYVTQFLKVLPRLPAIDVVAEPLMNAGVTPQKAKDEARKLLGRLNIPDKLFDAYPVTFSGGEQQRVNLARAIIGKPRLLLLDEPTASLDRASVNIVIELLNELREQGTTMLMIFHDPDTMHALADTIYRLSTRETPVMPIYEFTRPTSRKQGFIIENGRIVTPKGREDGASLLIHDGRIAQIERSFAVKDIPHIDASGLLVLPGFIDLHSDAIEKEIQPRPGGQIPVEIALVELDKRLASCGVTTMFHCLAFIKNTTSELRRASTARGIAKLIHHMAGYLSIHNKVHARFEMLHTDFVSLLEELIHEKKIHLFSIMDHTPGQGQFNSLEDFKIYYSFTREISDEELHKLIEDRIQARKNFDDSHIQYLTKLCRVHGIPMASHDDDTPEKVWWAYNMGVQISEFPVTLTAAQAATELGMHVLMGAPNILRGKSLTNNLSGRDAITQGYCDLIASDHSPSNILHSVFMLYHLQVGELHELVNMVSYNPAKAVGLENQTGSIAPGLAADLILVDDSGPVPRIVKTFVDGKQVFSVC